MGWPGGMAEDPRRCRRGAAPLRSLQVPVPPVLLPVLPALLPMMLPTPVLPVSVLLPVPVALAAGGRRCAALRGGRPVPVPSPPVRPHGGSGAVGLSGLGSDMSLRAQMLFISRCRAAPLPSPRSRAGPAAAAARPLAAPRR